MATNWVFSLLIAALAQPLTWLGEYKGVCPEGRTA